MKRKFISLIPAVALALGLFAPAFAQSDDAGMTSSAAPVTGGELGTGYSSLLFTYDHLDSSSPSMMRGFALDYNQPLHAGLDFNLGYDFGRAENDLVRLTQQNLTGGLTAYTAMSWGKPFVQALGGWEWLQGSGPAVNSLTYTVGAGVEFQVAQPLTLTPYVNFMRATGFNQNQVDYGVKTSYRLNRDWALAASVQYAAIDHANDSVGYTAGIQYHF